MNINVLGIDIAKNHFQLHGADDKGKRVLKKRLERYHLSLYIANLLPCTIVIEACGGANYWARVFQGHSHQVKLISPQFVKPFVKTHKNDANDAPAIVETASHPSMNFVPIKQVNQQDIQSLHRVCSRLIKSRTALINEIRGLNLEYGLTIPQDALKVNGTLISIIEDAENELTFLTRELMQDFYEELMGLETRIKKLDKKIKQLCQESEACKRY